MMKLRFATSQRDVINKCWNLPHEFNMSGTHKWRNNKKSEKCHLFRQTPAINIPTRV